MSHPSPVLPPAPARHAQLTAWLREQVLSGALAPDTRLPTSQELARRWNVHLTAVQAALAPLVAEGLLLRRPRLGTVVRGAAPPLGQVAVFHPEPAHWTGAERFTHRLVRTVAARLAEAGIATCTLADGRGEAEREAIPPDLLRLARSRQIDAVIACESHPQVDRWLAALPVPSVACGSGPHPHQVWFDLAQFARCGVDRLAARGCRSVGLISVLPRRRDDDRPPALHGRLLESFQAAAAGAGLATRAEWIHVPRDHYQAAEPVAERFGYDAVRALWSQPERPDGLLVFTDLAARGTLMALHGFLGDGRPPPRLVLHRNAELGLFCPLPADYLELSAATVADALIAQVQRLHRGQAAGLELLPFRLVAETG